MTEEIKEILDYLKPKYDIVDELGNDYKKVKFKDCKLLLNYITNLQKDNEVNKTYYDFYKDMSDKWKNLSDVYKKNYKDYKQRNEKAVGLLKNMTFYYPSQEGEALIHDLLNILQGGDE